MTELQSRRKEADSSKQASALAVESLEGLEDDGGDGDDDGGTAAMVMKEFVCALVRLRLHTYIARTNAPAREPGCGVCRCEWPGLPIRRRKGSTAS